MQNRDGVDEALELRGQHDVHEDERQREGQHEVVAGAAEFLGRAGQAGAIAGSMPSWSRSLVQLLDDRGLRAARQQVRGEGDLALAVDAVDGRRAGARRRCAPPRPGHGAAACAKAPSSWRGLRRCRGTAPARAPRTSYWSSPALKVEAFWPATSVFSACSISRTLTRRDRRRAGDRSPGALPACRCAAWYRRPPAPGLARILASSACGVLAELLQVGPWMKYWMSALL